MKRLRQVLLMSDLQSGGSVAIVTLKATAIVLCEANEKEVLISL